MEKGEKFKTIAGVILIAFLIPLFVHPTLAYCGSGEPEATASIFSETDDEILAFINVNFTSAAYSSGSLTLGTSTSSTRSLWLLSPYPCIDDGSYSYTFTVYWYLGSSVSITINAYDASYNLIDTYTRSTMGSFSRNYTAPSPAILVSVVFGGSAPSSLRIDSVSITSSKALYKFPITNYGSSLTPSAVTTLTDVYVSPKTAAFKFMTKPDGTFYVYHYQNAPIAQVQIGATKYYYVQPNERILTNGTPYYVYFLDSNDAIKFGTPIEVYQIDSSNNSVNCGSGVASAVKSISAQLVGNKPAYFAIGRNPSTYEAEGIAGAVLVDSDPLYVPYSGGGGIEPPVYSPSNVLIGNVTVIYPSAEAFNSTMTGIIAEYAAGNVWFSYAVMCIPFLFLFAIGRKYMWLVGLFAVGLCMIINNAAGAELWQQGALGVVAFICIITGLKEGGA